LRTASSAFTRPAFATAAMLKINPANHFDMTALPNRKMRSLGNLSILGCEKETGQDFARNRLDELQRK
jgi:hypothetical protein